MENYSGISQNNKDGDDEFDLDDFIARVTGAKEPVTITTVDQITVTVQPLNAIPPPPPKNRPPPKPRLDGSARKIREQVFKKPRTCEHCRFRFWNIPQYSGHLSKCTKENPWDGCPSRERSRNLPGAIHRGPHLRKKGAASKPIDEMDLALPNDPPAAAAGSPAKRTRSKANIKMEPGESRPLKRQRLAKVKNEPVPEEDMRDLEKRAQELDNDPEFQRLLAENDEEGSLNGDDEEDGYRGQHTGQLKVEPMPPVLNSGDYTGGLLDQPIQSYLNELEAQVRACTSVLDLIKLDQDLNQRVQAIISVKQGILPMIQGYLPKTPLTAEMYKPPIDTVSLNPYVTQSAFADGLNGSFHDGTTSSGVTDQWNMNPSHSSTMNSYPYGLMSPHRL